MFFMFQTFLTHAFDQSCGLGGTNSMYTPDILHTPDMDASPISGKLCVVFQTCVKLVLIFCFVCYR